MSTHPDIEKVVRNLTKAQRVRVLASHVIVLRSRHDTRIALNLERKNVAERGRHLNQFVLTTFGCAVRDHLRALETQKDKA